MITGVTAIDSTAGSSGPSGLQALGSDAFLKLLVAQLRYQNPLQPTDPSSMLAQTAQFTTVETLQTIADAQRSLMQLHEAVGSIGMIDRTVTAIGSDGETITGTVSKVRFGADGVMLTVDGAEVPLTQVVEASAGSE